MQWTANRTISPRQFAVMITASYLGAGIFSFPRDIMAAAGPQAPYAFLIECAAALGGLWLWFRVNRVHPDAPASYAPRLLTPWLASPVLALTLLVHIALAVVVVTDFTYVMQSFFLIETPRLALSGSIVLVAVYVAWFDVPAVARAIQFIFFPAIVISLLIGLLLIPHMTSLYALVPSTRFEGSTVLLAAYRGSYLFWGYELTLTLYPRLASADRRQAERYAYAAMIASFLIFAFGYVLTVSVMGPHILVLAIWPGVSVMRLVNIGSFLINKLGLLLVSFWSIFVLTFSISRFWCLAYDVSPLFKTYSATAYRRLLVVFAVLVLWGVQQFPTAVQLAAFVQDVMIPTVLFFNLALPPMFLLGAWVKRRRTKVLTTA